MSDTANTYNQVNITPYSQLQDEDNAFLDRKAELWTNANGEAKVTSQGANQNNIDNLPHIHF